jgi:hypothetical protein
MKIKALDRLLDYLAKRASRKFETQYRRGFGWAMVSFYLKDMTLDEIQMRALDPINPFNPFDQGIQEAISILTKEQYGSLPETWHKWCKEDDK